MSDTNKQNWGNYWQGRAGNSSGENPGDGFGEALVGVGIEHNEKLGAFWTASFAGLDSGAKILDMACGAGSVLRHAHNSGFTELSGVDISDAAIKAVQAEFAAAKGIKGVKGIVAPVDKTGLAGGAYDMVVSQYGFEYAGSRRQVLAAATEMARLLNPNGQFTALCHIKGGGIEQEVHGHLNDIKTLAQSNFIPAAKAVFSAAFAAESTPSPKTKKAYEDAVSGLTAPREKITGWIGLGQNGSSEIHKLGQHLYSGTIDLFNRRKAYSLADIIGWLDGMQGEIDAYKGRMHSMQQAALSAKDANNILAVFSRSGFEVEAPQKFYLTDDNKPAAWILKTR